MTFRPGGTWSRGMRSHTLWSCNDFILSSYAACQRGVSGQEKASLYDMGSSSFPRLHHSSLLNEKCMYPSGVVSMTCMYAPGDFSGLFLDSSDMHVDLRSMASGGYDVISGGMGTSSSICGGRTVCMRHVSPSS